MLIARLSGTLVETSGQSAIIDCQGVGYLVQVSAYTERALGETGSSITLRIHTQFSFQDGKVTLYGFSSKREHELFDTLIGVKGVSASKAIPMLSNADPMTLASWIAEGKAKELKSCKGIGKKTAETLVFELQEKCEALMVSWGHVQAASTPTSGAGPGRRRSPLLSEVGTALTAMGWKPQEVESAVGQLQVPPGATIETLLKDALMAMPR